MSYRIVKITTFYPEFLDGYYARNEGIDTRPFGEQYSHLMAQAFANADFYATHLRALGVDAYEIIANADPLQHAWAREHDTSSSGKNLLIAQLKHLRPDVVYFQDALTHNGEFIQTVRREVPGVRTILGWCCAPHSEQQLGSFGAFDTMLSCSLDLVEKYRRAGLRAALVNHAFEGSLLPRIQADNPYPEEDVFFAGSLFDGQLHHLTRKKILHSLQQQGVRVRIHGNLGKSVRHPWRALLKQPVYNLCWLLQQAGLGSWVYRLPLNHHAIQWKWTTRVDPYIKALQPSIRKPLFGLEMLKALSRCRIGFNCHIEATGQHAGNVRLFEITGVGACLVTDWKVNMHELFEPDVEAVTYTSPEDLIEKIKWLLDHPAERNQIAARGQQRTLRDHSFEKRAAQLNDIVRAELTLSR
jgi:spore maturation protein CgeB